MNLYPNPSNGDLTFEFGSKQKGELSIHRLTGEVLYTEQIHDIEQTQLQLPAELVNGMYLLRFKGSDYVDFKTVVLTR